jgi:hypothetical protein
MISAIPAHVFCDNHRNMSQIYLIHHFSKTGPVKTSAGYPIVCEMPEVPDSTTCGILLEHFLLMRNAVRFPHLFIIMAQSFI